MTYIYRALALTKADGLTFCDHIGVRQLTQRSASCFMDVFKEDETSIASGKGLESPGSRVVEAGHAFVIRKERPSSGSLVHIVAPRIGTLS
jgi:hypothetical protein